MSCTAVEQAGARWPTRAIGARCTASHLNKRRAAAVCTQALSSPRQQARRPPAVAAAVSRAGELSRAVVQPAISKAPRPCPSLLVLLRYPRRCKTRRPASSKQQRRRSQTARPGTETPSGLASRRLRASGWHEAIDAILGQKLISRPSANHGRPWRPWSLLPRLPFSAGCVLLPHASCPHGQRLQQFLPLSFVHQLRPGPFPSQPATSSVSRALLFCRPFYKTPLRPASSPMLPRMDL
jgi:hypothetical protein